MKKLRSIFLALAICSAGQLQSQETGAASMEAADTGNGGWVYVTAGAVIVGGAAAGLSFALSDGDGSLRGSTSH